MAIKLKDLRQATRTAKFTYAGEEINLTCRPASPWARVAFNEVAALANKPAAPNEDWQQLTARLEEDGAVMTDYITVIAELVTAWDVLGEDGQPLPITADTIARFPDRFIHQLFAAAVWGGSEAPNANGTTAKS